jgi:hypothetical protein
MINDEIYRFSLYGLDRSMTMLRYVELFFVSEREQTLCSRCVILALMRRRSYVTRKRDPTTRPGSRTGGHADGLTLTGPPQHGNSTYPDRSHVTPYTDHS